MPTPPRHRVENWVVIAGVGVSVVAMLANGCGWTCVWDNCGYMASSSAQLHTSAHGKKLKRERERERERE